MPESRILTLSELAGELGVSVPTIKRAVDRGAIVPSFRTAGGRVRFKRAYAEELKRRVEAARADGAIYVLKPLRPPTPVMTRQSAFAFAQQTAWKRRQFRMCARRWQPNAANVHHPRMGAGCKRDRPTPLSLPRSTARPRYPHAGFGNAYQGGKRAPGAQQGWHHTGPLQPCPAWNAGGGRRESRCSAEGSPEPQREDVGKALDGR
jgi:excisionase family DNA binding protein